MIARRGDDANSGQNALRGQIFRGDEQFAARMQARADPTRSAHSEVPRSQRLPPPRALSAKSKQPSWKQCLMACGNSRDAALLQGYRENGMTMTALAQAVKLSVSRVGRVIAAGMARRQCANRSLAGDAAANPVMRIDKRTGLPLIQSPRPVTVEVVRALQVE